MSGEPSQVGQQRFNPERRNILRGVIAAGAGAALTLRSSGAFGRPKAKVSARHDLIWGVNGHPITAYPGIELNEQFELIRELGFSHYRINLRGDGSPDQLDNILKIAASWDISIIPILLPDVNLKEDAYDDIRATSFELGQEMAKNFRDRIPIWELGNELENFAIIRACEMRDDGTQYPCEWGPAGGVGPLEYFGPRWKKVSATLKGLAEGVAAADPKALRAMGTAGFGHLGAFERMAQDDIPWEITVWHDYESVTEKYLERLVSYGKPIWVTEFNAGGGGDYPDHRNAQMIVERITYYRSMRAKYRLTAAFFYELLDEPYWGDHFEARMGLVSMKREREGSDRRWDIDAIKPQGAAIRRAIKEYKR